MNISDYRLPLKVIEKMGKSKKWWDRFAAVKACYGRDDIPLELLEQFLNDRDRDVCAIAAKTYQSISSLPIIRSFEPPEKVYKKCRGDVIVEAHIPSDAQVRGMPGGECRSNKAIIKAIYGDFYGEPIGISLHYKSICYTVGEEIEIDDFDYSDHEYSTGFHFFCTRKEAEEYEYC